MNGPACGHRHIEYRRVDHDGGTCSDSWVCRDCGTPFVPELQSDRRECIALRSLIHRVSPRAMHAHDNGAGLPRDGWYEDTEGGSRYHVFEVCSESVGRELDKAKEQLAALVDALPRCGYYEDHGREQTCKQVATLESKDWGGHGFSCDECAADKADRNAYYDLPYAPIVRALASPTVKP